ncbi:hypothetical protein [Halobacteriovorax sp. DA5]|uniref:hypothetical protein n=1 Tax=Halobacteriovorax sp. DA5 TaxID=2067553 RepID=UPI000CD2FD1A|nr:hypothetical protein [Halobacteriovorax sp. DA5]POB14395.1 hypothetical protein C0Z22_04695 [Halobacteriovorax sp. DA5]
MLSNLPSERHLKKRIEYFFHSRKGVQANEISNFIELLINNSLEVLIFGGLLRDLTIDGLKFFKSDVDIVLDGSEIDFSLILLRISKSYNMKKNKFGGYRIKLNYWVIDIWLLSNTFAFKKKHVEYREQKDLLKTVFFNWDAIYYNYNKKELVYSKDYFESLRMLKLSIVNPINHNPVGAFRRLTRFASKINFEIDVSVVSYFSDLPLESELLNNKDRELLSKIKKHFLTSSLFPIFLCKEVQTNLFK